MKNITVLFLLAVLVGFNQCTAHKDSAPSPASNAGGGKGGSLSRFAVYGDYLYTVDNKNLTVYKLQASGEPLYKNKIDVGPELETIFPFKGNLFIGSTSVLYIYSLNEPDSPKREGTAASQVVSYRCDPVVVKGDVAYATLRTGAVQCRTGGQRSVLAVYDVSDLKNPKEQTTVPMEEPYGLGYSNSGNVLYVCQKKGLTLFDISAPLAPKELNTIDDNWFKDVIPYDNLLICWTDKGLKLYDISAPLKPDLIAVIP